MPPDIDPDPREARRLTQVTEDAHERLKLDHRLTEPQKNYHTILEQQIQQAREDLERPAAALFLSGFAAGMDLGLGPLLMVVLYTLTADLSHAVREIMVASAYSAGFVFVVLGRSALFTEQTTSAVMPVLARRIAPSRLLRLWAIVLAANLVGATVIASIIAFLGPRLGVVDVAAMQAIAQRLLAHDSLSIAASAVLAGWLMGLLSWLVVAARDTVSQLFIVWLTTFLIGIVGLHHCIAGTVEILMAVLTPGGPPLAEFWRFLVLAVIGNAVGGSVFVALLKFGHVSASADG